MAPPYHPRMSLASNALRIGCAGLLLLSAFYCLPGHPSAGHALLLDGLVHAGLFLGIGLWFGWAAPRTWPVWLGLAAFAAVLELLQWWLGHFARIEWLDIATNEAGLAMAWLLTGWRGRRGRAAPG